MTQLPTTLSDSLPTPTPQRTVQGYDSQTLPNAQYQAGQSLRDDAAAIQEKQNKDAILDAQRRSNDAKAKVMSVLYGDDQNPGLFAARGGQAMGTSDKYAAQFKDIQSQAMDGVTNIQAQKALALDLQNLNLSNLDNVKRFEQQERRSYTTDLSKAQGDLDAQRAGIEANNQPVVDQLLATAEKRGVTNAKINGAVPGDLVWQKSILDQKSAVLSQQLDALSKSKDPQTLMAFNDKYDQYRKSGNLNLEAVDKFDKVKEVISPTIDAIRLRAQDNHNQLTYNVPDDQLIHAIVQTESGGNAAAVSPKGATGPMQIMPDTALALAGGDKDKAAKILNNPADNVQAGTEYYNKLKGQFGGDQRMALMAYNAGPTVVQDWMDGTNKSGKNDSKLKIGDPTKGQVSVDQFIAQVPFAETRAYPGKVMAAAGYTGTIGPMDMSVAADRATKLQPDAAKIYLEMAKRDNEAYAAQTDQQRKATMDAAINYMTTNNAGYSLMPVDLQTQINAAGITKQVQDYNPKALSDPATLMSLMNLSPKKLAETDLNTPDIRLSLSPQDYATWKNKQTQMSTAAGQVTETYMQNVLKDGFTRRGVTVKTHYDPNTGEAITDGGQDYIRAHDLLNTAIDAYSRDNNGRLPDPAAIQKMGDNIFTKIIVPSHHTLWWDTHPDANKYDVKIEDINDTDKKGIIDSLARKGIAPTTQNILYTYIKGMKDSPND